MHFPRPVPALIRFVYHHPRVSLRLKPIFSRVWEILSAATLETPEMFFSNIQ